MYIILSIIIGIFTVAALAAAYFWVLRPILISRGYIEGEKVDEQEEA